MVKSNRKNRLRIGTCSWKYDSWRGLIYSERGGKDYLPEYSRAFGTVEIDQWFWSLHGPGVVSLPRPEVAAGYVASVPEDFNFSIKVPNSITLTHYYAKSKSEPLVPNPHFLSTELFGQFLERLGPMRERAGVLMFQFEYLNRRKMASLARFIEHFSRFLDRAPSAEAEIGIEIRNPNYLLEPYFSFLRQRSLAAVFLQGYYMPPIPGVIRRYRELLSRTIVLRLHGPNRAGMEKASGGSWDRIIESRDDELTGIASVVRELLEDDHEVYLYVNNHYEGSAPLTIQRFKEKLKG